MLLKLLYEAVKLICTTKHPRTLNFLPYFVGFSFLSQYMAKHGVQKEKCVRKMYHFNVYENLFF